ncbi:MAG TPA: arsenate reductase ArsC [Clostridiales bacterium]|nr:arsenate reductase ArsC [Clostridiales bacterium]HQP69133.1 arsenate reductase ArsC [Clostridiales bacterium]
MQENSGNEMIKILFVCVHNSARSQMAEAFINSLGLKNVKAESAGLEEGKLNPIVVDAMKEIGIDISSNKTKTVYGFIKEGRHYHYVITVCDATSGERCPFFPGNAYKRLHWSFDDPSKLEGTYEEKLESIRKIRDEIGSKIYEFSKELKEN